MRSFANGSSSTRTQEVSQPGIDDLQNRERRQSRRGFSNIFSKGSTNSSKVQDDACLHAVTPDASTMSRPMVATEVSVESDASDVTTSREDITHSKSPRGRFSSMCSTSSLLSWAGISSTRMSSKGMPLSPDAGRNHTQIGAVPSQSGSFPLQARYDPSPSSTMPSSSYLPPVESKLPSKASVYSGASSLPDDGLPSKASVYSGASSLPDDENMSPRSKAAQWKAFKQERFEIARRKLAAGPQSFHQEAASPKSEHASESCTEFGNRLSSGSRASGRMTGSLSDDSCILSSGSRALGRSSTSSLPDDSCMTPRSKKDAWRAFKQEKFEAAAKKMAGRYNAIERDAGQEWLASATCTASEYVKHLTTEAAADEQCFDAGKVAGPPKPLPNGGQQASTSALSSPKSRTSPASEAPPASGRLSPDPAVRSPGSFDGALPFNSEMSDETRRATWLAFKKERLEFAAEKLKRMQT